MSRHHAAERIWEEYCSRFEIAHKAVSLFDVDAHGTVKTRMVGQGSASYPPAMPHPDSASPTSYLPQPQAHQKNNHNTASEGKMRATKCATSH
jgi:hypothetical protein